MRSQGSVLPFAEGTSTAGKSTIGTPRPKAEVLFAKSGGPRRAASSPTGVIGIARSSAGQQAHRLIEAAAGRLFKKLATPTGFESATFSLEGSCRSNAC